MQSSTAPMLSFVCGATLAKPKDGRTARKPCECKRKVDMNAGRYPSLKHWACHKTVVGSMVHLRVHTSKAPLLYQASLGVTANV